MIKKIAHLADIHLPKSPTRHGEIKGVFKTLYKSLREKKPNRIIIVGDLFHDFIDLQPECTILASEFLNELAKIAPVRITRGNHDIRKKSLKRTDSIEAVVKTINNPNIIYYNETDLFDDENITWVVWKHGDKKNNPWNKKALKRKEEETDRIFIDLFHDPINGAKSPTGFEFNRKTFNKIEHFKGQFSMFGDIHKKQYFQNKTKAYSGSLIAQNYAEGDYEFHGYLLWNIDSGSVEEIPIHNDYSFKTVNINPYTDFDDLDIDIEDPTKYMRIRILWKTLPQTHNQENTRRIVSHIKERYNPISISHKNEFIEDDTIITEDEVDIENIFNQSVQHEIFENYLEKIGVDEETINEIIKLDDEITRRIEIEELTNIQWSIVKFSAKNFMSYENIEVDWRDMNGLFQITGLNAVGKTTIMKLITYILYNKTKETEKVMKFGDQRYVNNRLNVDYCEGSIVIDVNGEYFGIKRVTNIEKKKDGEIKGAPTTLNYYKLNSPDDEFNDENALENLIDDERVKTQAKLEKAIGTYDNFMRVVMTTSDSLNDILSSDKAVFVDSILHDSGLDVFDHKLNEFKEYSKELSSVPRVTCNVELSEELIKNLNNNNDRISSEISDIENVKIPEILNKITKGEEFLENLIKKLNKIDDEIYNLNVDETNKNIEIINDQVKVLEEKSERLNASISSLKESYDENKLNQLQERKDNHYKKEGELKLRIKDNERKIIDFEHKIGVIKGDVLRKKEEGGKLKNEIYKLQNEKNCPTCGQLLDENHQEHIKKQISDIEKEMFQIANLIKDKEKSIPVFEKEIETIKKSTEDIQKEIDEMSLVMENILNEIGEITNDKNEVERRKSLVNELENIPLKIENHKLQLENIQNKIDKFNLYQKQIEENKKIYIGIDKSKERLNELKFERDQLKDDLYALNTQKGNNIQKIKESSDLILKFKEQERQDNILNIYKKCIHRDGIPTQMLKTYAIPKINLELSNLLTEVNFSVWLDNEDLKLKLAYNSRLDAAIDAISASGKERTFASVALKFALNQINMKSKPNLFLLDEVMGKLTEDSVGEFIEVLNAIKNKISKVLIVEHNHELNPNNTIDVIKNDDDISTLEIN